MRLWRRKASDESGFEAALAHCLESLDDAPALQRCLNLYPQYAERLTPLVDTAQRARRSLALAPREARRVEARQQFLSAATRQSQAAPTYAARAVGRAGRRRPPVLLRPLRSTFAPAALAVVFFIVALVPITGLTSGSALPGDWNYGFKRATERVRLALTIDPADRLNLQLAFHERRLGEIERLAAQGRPIGPSLRAFTNETSALVKTVKQSPVYGPSEAEKVAQVTQSQTQALETVVAPRVPQSALPAVTAAVDQSQAASRQAVAVVQAKQAEAPKPQATVARAPPSAPATSAAQAHATAAASATATVTASPSPAPSPSASPQATPSASPQATESVSPAPRIEPPSRPPILVPPAPPTIPPRATVPPARVTVAVPPAQPQATPVVRTAVPAITAAATSTPAASTPVEVAQPATRPAPLATLRATPSPSPTPTVPPLIVPPSQPPVGLAPVQITLAPGTSTSIVYVGPTQSITQALASIAGAYDVVYYVPPNGGAVETYYPGQSSPGPLLQRGAQITIHTRPGAAVTLTYPITP